MRRCSSVLGLIIIMIRCVSSIIIRHSLNDKLAGSGLLSWYFYYGISVASLCCADYVTSYCGISGADSKQRPTEADVAICESLPSSQAGKPGKQASKQAIRQHITPLEKPEDTIVLTFYHYCHSLLLGFWNAGRSPAANLMH
ncbi:hypothetical protein GQX74_012383 [Glossina fuscipes]|nr:hypothetical protein GQX74_012383 [Glossina fuscipes]